jgi:hypothetical protein
MLKLVVVGRHTDRPLTPGALGSPPAWRVKCAEPSQTGLSS